MGEGELNTFADVWETVSLYKGMILSCLTVSLLDKWTKQDIGFLISQ